MTNYDAFFEEYTKIGKLIETRFDQYKETFETKIPRDAYLSSWIYDSGFIDIRWSAHWRYGGYDSGEFYMDTAWLEMSEEEWQKFLNDEKLRQEKVKRNEERAKKAAATRARNEKENRERKRYEELKRKFEKEENNA
jgi:hypothetical protein